MTEIRLDVSAAQNAVARLDDGDYTDEERAELKILAEKYEMYLQREADKRFAEELNADFCAAWPEPPEDARVEWQDSTGSPYSAVRYAETETSDLPTRWWIHNCPNGEPHTWREIVAEMLDAGVESMNDVTILNEMK